eukprot:4082044-Prymnesium_polylepis.1
MRVLSDFGSSRVWFVYISALMRATVDQFKVWFRQSPMLVYTGRSGNANKLARIQPMIDTFCRENEPFLRETLGWKPGRGYSQPMAGQKGPRYKAIRDAII